tara:strand:- start:316 stop:1029 length:714 start_codon:yes stop_codon:yes gene_type:complete
MVNYSDYAPNFVLLELARRASGDTTGGGLTTNRLGLLVDSVDIQTNKQSLSFPVPFTGIVSGESHTLAIDLGLATKTITLTGRILDQRITKNNAKDGIVTNQNMTAFEVAQLIHSYVDSSFIHEDQNVSKIIVLIPSRVDGNYEYRNPTHESDDLTELPLIPFTWANRAYDVPKYAILTTDFPGIVGGTDDTEIPGITGYIDNFGTQFTGTEAPSVTFNLSFQHASTAASDFINAST